MERSSIATWYYCALFSYLTLIGWVTVWQLFLSPHPHINMYGITAAWLLPLLLPLWGIMKADPYTHAWSNFILMLYFCHALTLIWLDDGERQLALIELLLTSCAFICNIGFSRTKGKALGSKLEKLSVVERKERESLGKK